jgi:hypothetical protein
MMLDRSFRHSPVPLSSAGKSITTKDTKVH